MVPLAAGWRNLIRRFSQDVPGGGYAPAQERRATLAEADHGYDGVAKHTVRGFMAGAMKKAGFTVESFKPEGGERTYRINK